jgi:hypothetical protein
MRCARCRPPRGGSGCGPRVARADVVGRLEDDGEVLPSTLTECAAGKAELRMHELMEEKVLYPALKPHARARDIVLEGYQEHHVADVLVKELERLPPSDERWGAKFKVLKENIEHHIEEEEGDMFRTARVVLTRHQLDSIGRRMEALKSRRKAG